MFFIGKFVNRFGDNIGRNSVLFSVLNFADTFTYAVFVRLVVGFLFNSILGEIRLNIGSQNGSDMYF
jgi:hypothetical protein